MKTGIYLKKKKTDALKKNAFCVSCEKKCGNTLGLRLYFNNQFGFGAATASNRENTSLILQKEKNTIHTNKQNRHILNIYHVAILRGLIQLKTVAMIKLIMSKIKSKCKINPLRCRARSQIDAPSVRASKICSLEFSAVQPRSWGTGHSQQIQ